MTTASDLAPFVRGLWSGKILDSGGLEQLTRWTAGASFPQGHAFGTTTTGSGCGHTGFIGAVAFYARDEDAVLVGTHNQSQVDRWPLVGTLCRVLSNPAE